MKYIVVYHCYNTKVSKDLATFCSINNASQYLEEYILNFLNESQGRDKIIIYPDEHHKNSRFWNTYDYGYLATKVPGDDIYKTTIWRKIKIPGYIYDSHEMKKVFHLEIIRVNITDKYISSYTQNVDIDPLLDELCGKVDLCPAYDEKNSDKYIKVADAPDDNNEN